MDTVREKTKRTVNKHIIVGTFVFTNYNPVVRE